jgi:CubicO group peptidase (beta-lactamase class C family)
VLTGLIEKTLADNGIPSMSIALVRGDSIVWKAAFGYANMRPARPPPPRRSTAPGRRSSRSPQPP